MSVIRNITIAAAAFCLAVVLGLTLVVPSSSSLAIAAKGGGEVSPSAPAGTTEHVILFVLEGFGQESLKSGAMPVLSSLVKDGAVTWSATAVAPARRLPTMASLVTGMPVAKHGITWNVFEFSRGYPRAPTVFDYLDLSGGRDSAIFYMDESLYQLAKPEPYTDYQMCGPLRAEWCRPVGRLRAGLFQEGHEWFRLRPCDSLLAAFPGRAPACSGPRWRGAGLEVGSLQRCLKGR